MIIIKSNKTWFTCLLLILFFVSFKARCQEKTISNTGNKILNKLDRPKEITTKVIRAIEAIRNIEYISEDRFTIPYMPAVFHEPFISKSLVSVNNADTLRRSPYKFYILEDTFRIKSIYDGRYLAHTDDTGRQNVTDLEKQPFSAAAGIGTFPLRIKTLLKHAIKRNAEIEIVETDDSLKMHISFHDLQIEFMEDGIRTVKDTVGFVSQYIVYVDKYTYLPVKSIRKMPYQTSVETILYQKINFVDTLTISATDEVQTNRLSNEHSFLKPDSLIKIRFENTLMKDWKLVDVEGDSVNLSDIKGKKCLLAFNSIGWKPCVLAIPFLKQLRAEFSSHDLELVSIEPFINNADILKNHKHLHNMNYPLLLADPAVKKQYAILPMPTFMVIDKDGIIIKIITGFKGKKTEDEIRRSLKAIK